MSARRSGKSQLINNAVDYAAKTGHNLMLGTSKPDVWAEYLKERHPNTKFEIVENGVIINPSPHSSAG